jgi:hypothetical protein
VVELQDCQDAWRDPGVSPFSRRFTRRSPDLLNRKVIEKRMLLVGNFLDAQVLGRINRRYEAAEAQEQYSHYTASFEAARARLFADQQAEIDELKWDQDFAMRWLKKQAVDEIAFCTKRVDVIRIMIDEDQDIEAFVARKFKKPMSFVLPLTCTLEGGEDIPLCGGTRIGGSRKMHAFRETTELTPLTLPKLKARPAKMPRAYVPPPKETEI